MKFAKEGFAVCTIPQLESECPWMTLIAYYSHPQQLASTDCTSHHGVNNVSNMSKFFAYDQSNVTLSK